MKIFESRLQRLLRFNSLYRGQKKIKKIHRINQNTPINQKQKQEQDAIQKQNVRKFHKKQQDLEDKLQVLELKLKDLTGHENKQKRKRVYKELSQIKKALQNPDIYVKDPEELEEQKRRDQERRANKKKEKKKLLIKSIKNTKKHHRNHVCLVCKQTGHIAIDCRENPELQETVQKTYQCYMCGSSDHALKDCPDKFDGKQQLKFAVCFVCNEVGHISKDCPKNQNGIYPKGGGCHICGLNDHLKSNCPKNPVNQIQNKRKNKLVEQYFSDDDN